MPRAIRFGMDLSRRQQRPSRFRLKIEHLEMRRLLAAEPVITEFVASNRDSLLDGSIPPASPDWIEIYNAGDTDAILDGWHLTDDADDLTQWSFPPDTTLPAREFLVVFASGDTIPDAAGNLHTNFRLNSDGDYLALVMPDGATVASEFGSAGTDFPRQVVDVSYGLVMQPKQEKLIARDADARALVPTSSLVGDWTGGDVAFDDDPATSDWFSVISPVGFSPLATQDAITATDLESQMRFVNASALLRIPFEMDKAVTPNALTLHVAYDDGFIAFLNGEQIAASNAPVTPAFDAAATGEHDVLGSAFSPNPADVSIWYDFESDGGQAVTDKLTGDGQQNPAFNSGGNVDTNPANAAFGSQSLRLPQAPNLPGFFNRVQLPETANLGAQFTLALQANITETGFQRLFTNYNGTGPVLDNRFLFDIDPSGGAIPGLRVIIGGRGALQTESVPPQLLEPGYHHFAVTYDDGDIQVYVDSELVLSGELGSGPLPMPLDLFLGEDPHDGGGSAKEQLVGNLDDVVVLTGAALSHRDIRLLAQEGAAALFGSGGREPLLESFDVSDHLDAVRDGPNILAIQGLNIRADDSDFFLLPELSITFEPDGLPPAYFVQPTPGALNEMPVDGVVADTQFSVDRGFFENPFDVEVTVATPGATIVYTTDGSEPTLTNGTQVAAVDPLTAPAATIPIHSTTTLRAIGIKDGFYPSNIDTQTYLFLSDVIQQPDNPPGLPSLWGPTRADYGMDVNVVNVAPYSETIVEDLKSIPTMSLTLDAEDFFGPFGIYSNTTARGRAWERPVSVEYFSADRNDEFQINAGLRVHGGFSRDPTASPQHSLRLHFRSEYGPGRLEFPLFDDSDVTRFDALVLNAQSSDNWSSINLITGRVAQFLRDQWAQDMQREMGHVHVPGKYVHLYINGLYWGLYDVMERLDDAFAAEHWGGIEPEYDIIIDEAAFRGNLTAWNDLLGHVRAGDYQATLELLDVDNFIDYLLVNMHMGNWDWPDHNWHAVRRRVDGEKFQFVVWDAEVGMGLDVNVPGPIRPRTLDVDITGIRADVSSSVLRNGPGEIYNRLRTIPEFQLRFADRLQKHFFNGGALTPERAAAVYAARADEIESALVGQAARWGDVRREPPDVPDGTWLAEKNWILDTFFPLRTEIVLADFRDENLFPDVAAPTLNQHGGSFTPGFELTIDHTNPAGMILYTLDGSDPRQFGGAIAVDAMEYVGGIPLTGNVTVNARMWRDGEWSALTQAVFALDAQPIHVTEINYHPHEPTAAERSALPGVEADDFEFIEVLNSDAANSISMAGFSFVEGVSFLFPTEDLDPGERAVVVADMTAFRVRYGDDVRILGQWDGRLANGRESLELVDSVGATIVDFEYRDNAPWPQRADGNGGTLQLIDVFETPADELGKHYRWRGSSKFGGTPGRQAAPEIGVVINEVLANSDELELDAIELRNTTGEAIDISGWFLSDSAGDYLKYEVPTGTILAPGGYVVFDENAFNPTPLDPSPGDFALSGSRGDDIWLTIPDGQSGVATIVDDVHFRATMGGQTLGLTDNSGGRLTALARNTLGCHNGQPLVDDVLISTIQYLPSEPSAEALAIEPTLDGNDLEYLIVTRANAQIPIDGWRIRGGVDFDFPADGISSNSVWIVSFDPNDPANANKLSAFRTHYGISAEGGPSIIGGYAGSLSNRGEQIRLQRPAPSPPDDPGLIPYVTVDKVAYDDRAPWPPAVAGAAIVRRASTFFGDDGRLWRHVWAIDEVLRGDFNGDDILDATDIDLLLDAVNRGSQNAAYVLSGNSDTPDATEVVYYVGEILDSLMGDANLDGRVDAGDLNQLGINWLSADCQTWSTGDFNADGIVNAADLNVVGVHWLGTGEAVQNGRRRIPRAPLRQATATLLPDGQQHSLDASKTSQSARGEYSHPDLAVESPHSSMKQHMQQRRFRRNPARPSNVVPSREILDQVIADLDEQSLDSIQGSGIAVGTAVAGSPPHRSVREVFPHTAPALSRA